jgi:hypothetical protein
MRLHAAHASSCVIMDVPATPEHRSTNPFGEVVRGVMAEVTVYIESPRHSKSRRSRL